jgi:predicted enzyme related to lactoylglutathione lyase
MTVDRSIGLVLDCKDPEGLALFWSAALGYESAIAVENYVVLLPVGGSGPKLLLQKVPEAKATKNRMHLDIDIADIEAEARRLEALGARRLESEIRDEWGTSWIVMADPEGNEFCVCDGGQGRTS